MEALDSVPENLWMGFLRTWVYAKMRKQTDALHVCLVTYSGSGMDESGGEYWKDLAAMELKPMLLK